MKFHKFTSFVNIINSKWTELLVENQHDPSYLAEFVLARDYGKDAPVQ